MQIDFVKMHGLGNDFMVFDAPRGAPLPGAETWRALSNRFTGIGFDQALVLEPPRRSGTEVFYRIFNADGVEVEQCGNGARCIAALIARRSGRKSGELTMDSIGGLVQARVHESGLVSVQMGVPDFEPRALPFDAPAPADRYSLRAGDSDIEIGAVSIGNPHAVILVDSVQAAPVDSLGPAVENHPRFPKRTNVEFMQIVTPDHVRLRVHERGVGETLACGTGACGAVVVGRSRGLLREEVNVDVPGGRLIVHWDGAGTPVWLTGPAVTVFTGRVEI